MWYHTTSGVYTVKSGYGVALGLMENGVLGRKGRGVPIATLKNNQVWNRIWSLEVPNKMKFFILRCCNNALAVRRNLLRRHMRVDNVCGVCSQIDETENHLFFRCELSHLFWFCSSLQLNFFDIFLESWEKFWNRVKGNENAGEIIQVYLWFMEIMEK